MSRITPIRWQDFEKFLIHIGCEFVSQERTSHRKYTRPGLLRPIIVPANTRELTAFIIQNNLRTLGISREDYLEIMSKL
jgi:predicted RNA binding protein YcfA (HicA-like mRNA interferase family)